MSPAASLTVVHADEIVSHPSYAPCHRLSVPGEVGKDISEIKAILQHENVLYAVVVTKKTSAVVLWQAQLPLGSENLAWTVLPISENADAENRRTPRLEVDFLCVLHNAAIWLLPVNQPKVVFSYCLGKSCDKQACVGQWNRYNLSGFSLGKISRAASFGPDRSGIYVANEHAHGILDPDLGSITAFEHPPVAQMDDVFVIGDKVYGGDNGNLYLFEQGMWHKVLEAPKATFWACKGPIVYCFIKAKQHGKPLQVGLLYNTETSVTTLLDCQYIIPGETPFPYEIPSPIISHGPYFYFFTEDLKSIYALDVFTFCPYQPVQRQWQQFVNSPKFSDIVFSVSGKTFHGHKVLLSCYEYFSKLIEFPHQSCAEYPPGHPEVITINDISADAFYQLLHYLYCGQLHALTLTTATTIELLFAGNKYLLPSLAYKCSELLVTELEFLDLCDIITVLEAAYNIDETGPLFKKALEILLDRHPDFIAEPEFIQMASHNLNFYKKILRIATQFMILDKAKLICKANSSLTFD
jgi:hypothetical protein